MSNYTKTTDFDVKDSLPSGDTGKIIRGSEFEVEFENIEVAIASKADSLNTVLTGNTSVTNLSVTGNTTLGNAASDTVTVNADFSSDLLPSADATYDLGAPGSEWQDLYITGTANIDDLSCGTASFSANVTFGDNNKAIFGAGPDLQIYHDGSNSIIEDVGTGSLDLKGSAAVYIKASGTDESMAAFVKDGGAFLYHNNVEKLETTATGIDVTGTVTANEFRVGDNDKAIFGASSDLQIYHDGSNSYIDDAGTGLLRLRSNTIYLEKYTGELLADFNADGYVSLLHDNSEKFRTTSTGIDVTGTVTADNGVFETASVVAPSTAATFAVNVSGGTSLTSTISQRAKSSNGANAETSMVVTGSGGEAISSWDFKADTTNGSLTKVMTLDGNGDVSFYEDTGVTAKFFWDASAESLGIGTSSPSGKLTLSSESTDDSVEFFAPLINGTRNLKLYANASSEKGLFLSSENSVQTIGFSNNGGVAQLRFVQSTDMGTTNTEFMRLDESGNLLVGTSTVNGNGGLSVAPSASVGSAQISFNRASNASSSSAVVFKSAGSTVGQILYSDTATAYNTSSDVRLKENITDAPEGNVDAIQVRSFDWKVDGAHQEYGFIAQELEAVAPYAVTKGETEEDMWGVDYSKLVPMLVKEIQDLKARIATLEAN